jgi:hypothetical protein
VSKAKHTLGPWTVFGDDGDRPGIEAEGVSVVIWGDLEEKEEDYGGVRGKTPDEALANARLIAAAPDLLAACESVYYELDTLTGGEPTHPLANTVGMWKFALRAAIAKAKGQP